MLNRILKFWNETKIIIVASVIALAYFIGIKRGKNDEKAHQNKATLANLSRADSARRRLDNDPDAVRRLHDKFKRE
jgi:predicted negative regulator of RcsB-dependent stress response